MLAVKQCLGCAHEGVIVAMMKVRDSGSGIPADVQSKLFEPFFTTKLHGTGLGLATSPQTMFEHNGHLLVESQPGKGTTFSLLLPI